MKKKALLLKDVSAIPIPHYRELATKAVWSYIGDIPELLEFFPDLKETQLPDRSFMWGILGTLRTEACQELLENARVARSKGQEEEKGDLIEIHPNILEQLMKVPTTSQGKGRVAFLLKSARPQRAPRKPQRIFPVDFTVLRGDHEEEAKDLGQPQQDERRSTAQDDMNVDVQPKANRNTAHSQSDREEVAERKDRSDMSTYLRQRNQNP